MAESEQQRAQADHYPGHQRRQYQVPAAHGRQIKSDVAAQPVKDDVAEVHVAGVADHQIQIAGQDDGDGDQDEVFAQGNVVAVQGKRRCKPAAMSRISQKNGRRRIMRWPSSRKCRAGKRPAPPRTDRTRSAESN